LLKTIKNRKTLFVFIKLILFVGVLFLLYNQINRIEEGQWNAFELKHPMILVLVILLVVPNIGLAFLKWKLTLKTIEVDSVKKQRVQSFFAGVVTGMLTPNMLGNFIGRFYYFDRKNRVQITLFTMLSNFAQFIASITFGWLAVLLLDGLVVWENEKQLVIWVGLSMITSYLIYFFIENFMVKFRKRDYSTTFKTVLHRNKFYRVKLLLFSLLRFIVFTLQFSLLLFAFDEELNTTLIFAIWQVYLLTMLAPSLFFGKIGIKESISLFVLGAIGVNEVSILFTSVLIWLINSFAPALLGVFICKSNFREWQQS